AQAGSARRRPWADQRSKSARVPARSCDPGWWPRPRPQQPRPAPGVTPVTSCSGVTEVNAPIPSTESGPLHARFDGPIVMIGFGSIGKGTLPLIERHIAFDRAKFVVIAPDDSDRRLLDERQIRFIHRALTKEHYRDILTPLLTTGPGRGMVVNLSVDTSSVDLMEFCKDLDAFYIDTVVEPWPGLYTDRNRSISERSNYALREGVLDLRRRRPGGITAVSCCGANPGMVSWMVKQALIDIAGELKLDFVEPQNGEDGGRR